MKVSLITVSYNSEETIRETFESVRKQKIEGFELEYIHVDGLSNDSTMEISNEFNDIITKRISEKDSGIYNAMNKGISLATGDIIGILNSDDVYSYENVLKDVMQIFSKGTSDAVYADLNYVKRSNSRLIVRSWKSGEYSRNSFQFGWMPPHPTFFVKSECYSKYGKFNEDLKSAADYELMLRFIHRHRITCSYIPKKIVDMKDGGNSNQSFRHRFKVFKENRKAWKLNFNSNGILPITFKVLRVIPQFFIK
jgi:glycosyltransferase involved in cell wall biosynthesis